jgi:apolipoprotein N-acyltransferase
MSTNPLDRTWIRALVAIGSGALLAAIAPPLNLHWLHWAAFLPMFWALHADRSRANRWLGYLYGIAAAATIFSWLVDTITVFSNLPWILAVAVLFLYSAVFGAPYALTWALVHPLRRRLGTAWVFAWPAAQVVIEFASTYVLLFPYQQGVSQYRVPLTWQLVSVTGIYGLTYLILLVNAVWAEALYRRRDALEGRDGPPGLPWLPAAVAAMAVLSTLAFGKTRYEAVEAHLRTEARELRVAQLQSSTTMQERLETFARAGFQEWVERTRRVPKGSVDLVIWPEGACPYSLNPNHKGEPSRAADALGELAAEGDFELVVGGGTRLRDVDPEMGETRVRVFNSVYWYDRQGQEIGHYDKMVPLPFGEYLPFGDYVPWLGEMIGGIGNFKAGTEPVVFDGVVRAATPICYEAILPALCRQYVAPEALINVTNDAWFGDGAAPHLHAMLAAIRATELGIPVIRSGYTGISFVVEPHGVIHSETAPFEDVARIVHVRVASVPTLYAQLGDWFVLVCALGLGVGWLVAPSIRKP